MYGKCQLVYKIMKISFKFPLDIFEFSQEINELQNEKGEITSDYNFTENYETNNVSRYYEEINREQNYIDSHPHIKLVQIPGQSRVEYLSDEGKIVQQLSSVHLYKKIYLFKPLIPKTKYFSSSLDIIEYSPFNSPLFKLNKAHTNSHNKDNRRALYFTINPGNFYLIKLFNIIGYKPYIFYDYTEFEYIPLLVQIFFHIPLILTAIIFIIVILTFDPEFNIELIRNEIEKLPEIEYTENINSKECTICLESFILKDKMRVLPCNHCFHTSCIDNWLLTSLNCPICRKSVSKLTEIPEYEIYRNINYI